MVKKVRFDNNRFSDVVHHDKGFLTAWGTMSRVGVQEYSNKDGTVTRELRLPEEVFNEDSLKSFNNIPVTNGHPRKIVTAENAKEYQRGLTGDKTQKKDEGHTINKVTVTDAGLISEIETGKSELSLGYECDVVFESGVHSLYGKYDAVQRNIRGNHLAVVSMGKAGQEARLHLDSYEDDVAVVINKNINQKEKKMKTLKIDGKDFEVSEEAHKVISSFMSKADKAKTEFDSKLDGLATEIKGLKSKQKQDSKDKDLTTLQAKYDNLEESIPAKAKEYAKALNTAEKILDKESFSKLDGKDIKEIKKEVVKSHCKIDIAEKSESYIEARFDILSEDSPGEKEDEKELGDALSKKGSKKEDSIEEFQRKKNEEQTQAWKKNLNNNK